MCARFEIKAAPEALLEMMGIELESAPAREPGDAPAPAALPPELHKLGAERQQLDIRPTDAVLIATNEEPRRVQSALWGFLGGWSEPIKGTQPLRPINARDDKLDRDYWKPALERHRCLIPATSFFEWRAIPGKKKKQPVKFSLRDYQPFCFAGLWNVYKGKLSCTIITTTPSPLIAPVHDRMPAILSRESMAAWMRTEAVSFEEIRPLLGPYPAEMMISEEVDPRDPASLTPPPEDPQLDLF